MKEFIFHCGNYRHFIVGAPSKEQAIETFKATEAHEDSWRILHGFGFKDVTLIEEAK